MERRIVVGAVGRAFSIGRTIGGEVGSLVGVKDGVVMNVSFGITVVFLLTTLFVMLSIC